MNYPFQIVIRPHGDKFYYEVGHVTHEGIWKTDIVSGSHFHEPEMAQAAAERTVKYATDAYTKAQRIKLKEMLTIMVNA